LEQRIRERYSDSIKTEAMKRYGIEDGQIKILDGFESYIYEYQQGDEEYILRIGHSLRRSVELIHGEVDWINYLAAGGASVSKTVGSMDGNLVEQIPDSQDGCFLATAFVRAAGGPPGDEQWNDHLFENWGVLLGRLHALSKVYSPANPRWKRPEWDDKEMLDMESWLPPAEDSVLANFRDHYRMLKSLPQSSDSYGLIHQDAHGGNFFVDPSGRITLFDFDDCCYSWYMSDIAIVLFYAANGQEDPSSFTGRFMKHFIRGYVRENEIDLAWLPRIPLFLKQREIELYAIIHRSFDVDHIEDRWVASYMKDRKAKILGNVAFVDYDWESLAEVIVEAIEAKAEST
jgi:Ser/Thr protein kinase RdoA (MazF antagonist)